MSTNDNNFIVFSSQTVILMVAHTSITHNLPSNDMLLGHCPADVIQQFITSESSVYLCENLNRFELSTQLKQFICT